MIGQVILAPGGRGRAAAGRLYGLPVLRVETNPEGFWGERRLRRAGRTLRQCGALRVLLPRVFPFWPQLAAFGLRTVDPELFVRAQSVPLALAALARQDVAPDRATVALRGARADRDMARIAVELCVQVRRLVVDAPNGGEELARWLREEYGVPILPPGEAGQLALCFSEVCPQPEETALELHGPSPQLAGLSLTAPKLEEEDRDDLPLLAALWEGGRLGPNDIKIT